MRGLLQHRADLLAQHLSKLPSGDLVKLEAALTVFGYLIVSLEGRTLVGANR